MVVSPLFELLFSSKTILQKRVPCRLTPHNPETTITQKLQIKAKCIARTLGKTKSDFLQVNVNNDGDGYIAENRQMCSMAMSDMDAPVARAWAEQYHAFSKHSSAS
jgi:hypothetical protein